MKKRKKILIIIGIVAVVLGSAVIYLQDWLQDYSVKMSRERIPKVTGLPSILHPGEHDWPSWKGMTSDNKSSFTEIKTDWSQGLNKLWEAKYLCKGDKSVTWSCPAIKGNRLVIPGRHEEKDIIFCLGPDTGKLIWYRKYDAPAGGSSYGEGPRSTPFIDADRVYTLSRGGLLHCWNLFDGKLIWKANLITLGGKLPLWGFAGSPIIHKDKLLVNVGNEHLLIAFNKHNGKVIWKSKAAAGSYSTPAIMKVNGIDRILLLGGQAFYLLEPETGEILAETPWPVKNDINICTPVISLENSIAVISSYYKKGIEAVKISEKGMEVLWKNNNIEAHQADPYILDGYIYGYSGLSAVKGGTFKCLDLKTGKEIWSTKKLGTGQFIYVEPFFLSLDSQGNLYLVEPQPEGLKIVSSIKGIFEVDKARSWTKPIIAHGKLYLRYANQLYCYDISKK